MTLAPDISKVDEQFRRTFLAEKPEYVTDMPHQNIYLARSCYMATASDFVDAFRRDYIVLSTEPPIGIIDKQFSLISLSQAMFKNAKPLEGNDLALLNKTYSKHFSSTPTRL